MFDSVRTIDDLTGKQYMALVARLSCIICRKRGYPDSPAEVHHVRKNGGLRENVDKWTIPLCPYHHRIGPDAVHNARRLVERLHGISEEAMAEETRRDVEEMLNGRDQRNA